MEQPEYMRMKLSNLPHEFIGLYDLTKIAEYNSNVYIKKYKRECMASLKQAYLHSNYQNTDWMSMDTFTATSISELPHPHGKRCPA